ncbi:MAG: trigger factor [Bacteroidales bacterium]|jgi:trigger factor|nr:trigger factor [Bacteroidales bacterium]
MNINKKQVDDLTMVVSLEIANDDYISKVNDVLRDYRRKSNMSGFRPGKAPDGLIRKMYGKPVLVDELNKLVRDTLSEFIENEKLPILGEPLPAFTDDDNDWEIGNNFTFDFEIGLVPKINIHLSKDDHLTKYQIVVDQELIDRNIKEYTSRFGHFAYAESVTDFTERITGNIVQLDENKEPQEGGVNVEDTTLYLSLIKDEEYKKPFINAKVNDSIDFDLSATFPNEWEIATILKQNVKEDTGDVTGVSFRFTVTQVETFNDAELNQELFDKVFSDNTASSPEEFRERIEKDIAANFEYLTMNKFGRDARQYLLEKINPPLPETFLHKFLRRIKKEEVSESDFEQQFPAALKTTQWNIIADAIVQQNGIEASEQEMLNIAKETIRKQFAYYGIANCDDNVLTSYAMNQFKEDDGYRRKMADRVLEEKIIGVIYQTVDVTVKEISIDEFHKMENVEEDTENQEVENKTIESQKIENTEIIQENNEK